MVRSCWSWRPEPVRRLNDEYARADAIAGLLKTERGFGDLPPSLTVA